jgi:hypothetical protein
MNQDEIWKTIIQKLFKEFVEFFIPDVYPEINFDKGYEFLDKELNKILPKSKTKNRRADKLIKVFLKNGKEQWILVHTEIQGVRQVSCLRNCNTLILPTVSPVVA